MAEEEVRSFVLNPDDVTRLLIAHERRERGFKSPRDFPLVLVVMEDSELARPSRWDFADLIAVIERHGGPLPASLAWLIRQSEDAYKMACSLRQTTVDIGTLSMRGRGVLFAAHCQADLESILDAPPDLWVRPDEVLGDVLDDAPQRELSETVISGLMLRMLSGEIERTEDEDVREALEAVRIKVEQFAADEEDVKKALHEAPTPRAVYIDDHDPGEC